MAGRKMHTVFVVWGTVEIVLFAGLIFGWASLVYVLKGEGFFRDTCEYTLPPDPPPRWPDSDMTVSGVVSYTGENMAPNNNNGSTTDGYRHTGPVPPAGNSSKPDQGCTGTECEVQNMLPVINCNNQDENFNLVYTLATVINGISLIAAGWLFDRFGTRVVRILGMVIYLVGTLTAAFSSAETSVLLYPSMISLALGGYFVLLTNMQLGNLIPDKRATIISLHCGAYDSSAFIMVLIKVAWEGGISIRASFLMLTVLFSMFIISTWLFMPSSRIPHPLPSNYQLSVTCGSFGESHSDPELSMKPSNSDFHNQNHNGVGEHSGEDTSKKESSFNEENSASPLTVTNPDIYEEEQPSFYSIACTWLYIWDVIYLCGHRFASWSYVGRLNPALNRLANGNKHTVSQYTSVYALIQFFGIFIAPLSGRLMDRKKKTSSGDERADKVEMCILSFVLDCSVGLALAIITCIPIMSLQYAAFVLHVIHRACLYGPNTAFIAQAFPALHFGKLFGLGMSIAAAFSLLQYPIFVLIQDRLDGDPLVANLFTLCLMVISFGHPIYMRYWAKRQHRNVKNTRGAIYKPTAESQEEANPLKTTVDT